MSKQIRIGLFGFGVVGNGLHDLLNQTKTREITIDTIVVKDPDKERSISKEKFSFDPRAILDNPRINVVVELINDSEAAYLLVKEALSKGKNVVSANKKMIATQLDELILIAKANQVSFLYEAAVAGAIPIIRNLEEYYNSDTLSAVQGIVNGTTNYILTKTNTGMHYCDALEEAQRLGYAEKDPRLDVEGFDAKYKLVLLIKHAFGVTLASESVFNYGIQHVKKEDVAYASEKGYRIKLLARAEKLGNHIVGFVAPHFVPTSHGTYAVDNEFNALIVEAAFADKQLFIGKGAGSFPTASAVLSDVSALHYDYQYAYKKSYQAERTSFLADFCVQIYAGSADLAVLDLIPFLRVETFFQGDNYNYKTGWIRFGHLKDLNLNTIKELFFAVLPEPLFTDALRTNVQSKQRDFEAVEYSVL